MNDNLSAPGSLDCPAEKHRGNRFGKGLKIKRGAEIVAVLRGGRRYACRYFKICYLGNGLNRSRYALITPRSVGCAVMRNRSRRVMRELLRMAPSSGHHLDVLFRLTSLTGSASADALKGALAQWYESLKK